MTDHNLGNADSPHPGMDGNQSHNESDLNFGANQGLSQKLSDWAKEPSVEDLKRDLEAAKPAHLLQLGRIQKWNDLLHVKGEAKPAKIKGRSSVQPKLIRRQAEWRYSALTEPFLGTDRLFKVDPATAADGDGARQNQLVLNWQWRTKLNKIKFVDDYVRANVDEGTCIVRVGWLRVTTMVKQEAPVYTHYAINDEQTAQQFQQYLQAKQEEPKKFLQSAPPEVQQAVTYYEEKHIPTTVKQTGTQEVTVEKVIENRPTAEVLDPHNCFIDPSCNGDISKAMFCVISFETCKADLKKEKKKYKNLDKVVWSSNSPSSEPDHASKTPSDFVLNDEARRKVVAYEYWGWWDMEGDDVLVPFVATWIGSTLIRMEENPYPDQKLPIVLVPYMPKKRDLYGEPDAELLKDGQRTLGAVTRGMIDLLGRSANGQQGIAKGMLDPLNRRRYESGQDYEFNPNLSPAQGIIEHKYPEMPQSALQMAGMINQEAEALTGVKSFSGGLSGSAYGKQVGTANDVVDAAATRETAILRRLAKGMTEIGVKFMSMNAEFLSEEEVIKVTDDTFVTVKREDLKGNFDLIVDISTAASDEAKAQDMGFMLQTCGPSAGPEVTMMIMADIADLKRMPVLAQKLRTYKPPPPPPPSPQEQQIQQLQIQLLQAQLGKVQAETQLLGAKASETSSKKDLMDLDYVEQEGGTKHAREMQKQAAQSEGNQNLQVTKALTTPQKEGEKAPDIHAALGYNAISSKLNEHTPTKRQLPLGISGAS